MEKSIGYHELTVDGQVIQLKAGMGAVEVFCEVLGVDTDELLTLFKEVDNPKLPGTKMPFPKNYIKFIAVALWASANDVKRRLGGDLYEIQDSYDWLDKLGIYSPPINKFFEKFYMAVFTGKPSVITDSDPKAKKKAFKTQ